MATSGRQSKRHIRCRRSDFEEAIGKRLAGQPLRDWSVDMCHGSTHTQAVVALVMVAQFNGPLWELFIRRLLRSNHG